MSQLMPLPLTVSCFSKIQTGFTFLVLAHPGSPGKRAVKWMCVCVLCPHSNCHAARPTPVVLHRFWVVRGTASTACLPGCGCCCCWWHVHQVVTEYILPLWSTCLEKLRVWTEEVLQWYQKFPVVLVECQGNRASVPVSVEPGYILASWGQLCCPNVFMPEGGYNDRISAELVVWHLSWMQSRTDLVVHCGQHKLQPSESVVFLGREWYKTLHWKDWPAWPLYPVLMLLLLWIRACSIAAQPIPRIGLDQARPHVTAGQTDAIWRDTFTLEVPVVIRLTCDCAVADDAVMPIRAESSSWLSWWGSGVN